MFVKPGIFLAVAALMLISATAVKADERYKPVQHENVVKECGACHMAFQPQMLPKKSWRKIIAGLADHFGEDASLKAPMSASIEKYYVENAANSGWRGGKFMRGLTDESAPLRITETPYWVREHNHEVPERAWKDPKVKSKANCVACHPRASLGIYEDD